jgi:transposase
MSSWDSSCALEPIRVVARMIRNHFDGIINAASSDITNAMSEPVNSHIQRIKKRACGFRSRTRFRVAILFHLGALPVTSNIRFLAFVALQTMKRSTLR